MRRVIFTILICFILFFAGLFLTSYLEIYYRRYIQFLYKWSTNGNLTLVGKNFRLFPKNPYLFSLGIYLSILFLFFRSKIKTNYWLLVASSIFFIWISIVVISFINSNIRLLSCTACNDGKLSINLYEVPYDEIVSLALLVGLIPIFWKLLRKMLKSEEDNPLSKID